MTPPRTTRALFVTGTDTGIGKTVVSLLLMRTLFRRGEAPFYYKLVQTGCATPDDTDSDARFIYTHTPELTGSDPASSVGWCFSAPKAPLYAAQDELRTIETDALLHRLASLRMEHACLVVEGAGGLMVPFTADALGIDLIRAVDLAPILVARAGLGTVNHTLLSVEALDRRGVMPAGIVFVHNGERPTAPDLIRDNMEAVAMFSGIPVCGVVPHIANLHAPPDAVLGLMDRLLDAVPARPQCLLPLG